ncbi:hypothetical protein V6N11_068916 [Hibiscus sabdariffa]|uniref:UBC core domain-containing protein n=1 Tax=Hibiscus sabdariffa TaxID=183260 RepID=A0ABR2PBJ3_9ROSI
MSSMKPLPPSPPPSSSRRACHDTRNSKKRLISVTPNSSFLMEPEVVEIPPPIPSSFKFNKKKQVVIHEVIDVENDGDSSDVMILDEIVDVRNKGKAVKGSSGVYSPIEAEDFVIKPPGSINKVEPSKHSTLGSQNAYNLDGDLAYDDDFHDNYCLSDFWDVDEYAMLQSHFDNFDIPAGVEASVPWFPDFSESKKNTSHANTQSSLNGNDQSHSTWLSKPAHVNKKPASSFLTPVDPISHSPGGAGVSSTFLFPQGSQSNKSATSQHKWTSQILPVSSGSHSYSMKFPSPFKPTYRDHFSSDVMTHIDGGGFMPMASLTHTMVAEPSMSWWPPPMKPKYNLNKHNVYSSFGDPLDGANITPQEVADIRNQRNVNAADILSKFQHFKQFDTVEDFSDHHYAASGSSTKQPPKNWAKKIQQEWRMLEKDLPDTIFVRVYESRMDLLRAVIIGAEGTPYHDGLFFFDVFFPASYPKAPPHVYYHSGGLRLNPNLYSSGKVCLSLLNTWSGNKNEKWIPEAHNKTMVYSMRRPPKHFEDFVVGHFYGRAQNILVACKAYMDGAQVGCLAKGGIQDVDEGDRSCSKKFKDSVAGCVNMLVKEFTVLGVKDCEKFLTVPQSQNNLVHKVSIL